MSNKRGAKDIMRAGHPKSLRVPLCQCYTGGLSGVKKWRNSFSLGGRKVQPRLQICAPIGQVQRYLNLHRLPKPWYGVLETSRGGIPLPHGFLRPWQRADLGGVLGKTTAHAPP